MIVVVILAAAAWTRKFHHCDTLLTTAQFKLHLGLHSTVMHLNISVYIALLCSRHDHNSMFSSKLCSAVLWLLLALLGQPEYRASPVMYLVSTALYWTSITSHSPFPWSWTMSLLSVAEFSSAGSHSTANTHTHTCTHNVNGFHPSKPD